MILPLDLAAMRPSLTTRARLNRDYVMTVDALLSGCAVVSHLLRVHCLTTCETLDRYELLTYRLLTAYLLLTTYHPCQNHHILLALVVFATTRYYLRLLTTT